MATASKQTSSSKKSTLSVSKQSKETGKKAARLKAGGNPDGKKKWAKATGGYGPLSVEGRILVDFPIDMKLAIGRAAGIENRPVQEFVRRVLLAKLMEMRDALIQSGHRAPVSLAFVAALPKPQDEVEEFLRLMASLVKVPELAATLLDLQKVPHLESLARQVAELMGRVEVLEAVARITKRQALETPESAEPPMTSTIDLAGK